MNACVYNLYFKRMILCILIIIAINLIECSVTDFQTVTANKTAAIIVNKNLNKSQGDPAT